MYLQMYFKEQIRLFASCPPRKSPASTLTCTILHIQSGGFRERRMFPNTSVFPAGIFTERFGLGARGFFTHHRKNSPASPAKSRAEIVATPPQFQSHPSIESANTISNSSLQDLDETEFTGSELARYMGELNFELVT